MAVVVLNGAGLTIGQERPTSFCIRADNREHPSARGGIVGSRDLGIRTTFRRMLCPEQWSTHPDRFVGKKHVNRGSGLTIQTEETVVNAVRQPGLCPFGIPPRGSPAWQTRSRLLLSFIHPRLETGRQPNVLSTRVPRARRSG